MAAPKVSNPAQSVRERPFMQIDVFSDKHYLGNPVAVCLDGSGLSTEQMASFARWTNLSETTFILPPSEGSSADYRVRIFTPARELPFAGHPTLGTCRAWLGHQAASNAQNPGSGEYITQESAIGLVKIKRTATSADKYILSFAAPPFLKREPVLDEELIADVCASMKVERKDILGAEVIDNGPGWIGFVLPSAQKVLDAGPIKAIGRAALIDWGIIGPYPNGVAGFQAAGLLPASTSAEGAPSVHAPGTSSASEPLVEIRAFAPPVDVLEDPVTGSLNAGFAIWLIGRGALPQRYVASQGTCLQRSGRIFVEAEQPLANGGEVWVGGHTTICIEGTVFI